MKIQLSSRRISTHGFSPQTWAAKVNSCRTVVFRKADRSECAGVQARVRKQPSTVTLEIVLQLAQAGWPGKHGHGCKLGTTALVR